MANYVLDDDDIDSIMKIIKSAILNPPADDADSTNQIGVAPSTPTKSKLCWGATISQDAVASVLWAANDLGLMADYLMACMKFESGLNPRAKNPGSSATGLIQFMTATAVSLGTTTAALATMDFVHQMNYVWKYFNDFKKRGYNLTKWTLYDTYMAILWPAGIDKPTNYPIFDRNTSAYLANRPLDINSDGVVTVAEACSRVVDLYNQGMQSPNVLEY